MDDERYSPRQTFLESKFYHQDKDAAFSLYSDTKVDVGEGLEPVIIRHRRPFTFESLLTYYQINVTQLPAEYEKIIRNLTTKLQEGSASIEYPETAILFDIWRGTRNIPSDAPIEIQQIQKNLTDINVLIKSVKQMGLRSDIYTLSAISFVLGRHQTIHNSLYKLVQASPGSVIETGIAPNVANWIYAGTTKFGYQLIADAAVVLLADQYQKDPRIRSLISNSAHAKQPEQRDTTKRLFHDTTNTALSRILEEGTLLSPAEAVQKGLVIQSGEYMNTYGGDTPRTVFASSEDLSWGNVSPSFFGENIVTLIIDEKRQEETMREVFKRINPNTPDKEIQLTIDRNLRRLPTPQVLNPDDLSNMTREEVRKIMEERRQSRSVGDTHSTPQAYESYLGPYVPLSNCDAIALPQEIVARFQDAVSRYNLKLIVREAAHLVNIRDHDNSQEV